MIKRLKAHHKVLCTSRNYREAVQLAKIRNLKLKIVGRHGGSEWYGKLDASINRMNNLSKIIKKFSPQVTISFCSPEASRISFGLDIPHIAFCNAPHAESVLKLSIPLVQKLLIPWIIPKREFIKFGISKNNIIQYKALDESVIVKSKPKNRTLNLKLKGKKTLLLRMPESQAAYLIHRKKNDVTPIIKKIIENFSEHNIIILGRYSDQIKKLKTKFGKKIIVLDKVVDSGEILAMTDVFIGSGGTMTQEAALRGIPTISYSVVPGYRDEQYLAKRSLVKIQKEPKKIVFLIEKYLNSNKNEMKRKAKAILSQMEDPFPKLLDVIKSVTE
jgi:hypothetical protein